MTGIFDPVICFNPGQYWNLVSDWCPDEEACPVWKRFLFLGTSSKSMSLCSINSEVFATDCINSSNFFFMNGSRIIYPESKFLTSQKTYPGPQGLSEILRLSFIFLSQPECAQVAGISPCNLF